MQITDSIADMLTRIRNANSAKHDTVKIPASNMMRVTSRDSRLRTTASRASSR